MSKMCTLHSNKLCNQCDECFTCDFDPSKKCDNCGKCLEMEGYDIRAIRIDEIFEDKAEFDEYEDMNKLHSEANKTLDEDSEFWEYIDDIKELKDLLEEDKKLSMLEEYPGLISLNKINKNEK